MSQQEQAVEPRVSTAVVDVDDQRSAEPLDDFADRRPNLVRGQRSAANVAHSPGRQTGA
jgi:hypothetical protein